MLELTPDDAKVLTAHYESERSRLQQELDMLSSQLANLNERLGVLTSFLQKEKHQQHNLFGYDPNWSWNEKITFVLKGVTRPMSRAEIINSILGYEPSLGTNRVVKDKAANSIGATLSTSTDRLYTREKNNVNDYVYSLINEKSSTAVGEPK